jgi:hypothetical protein
VHSSGRAGSGDGLSTGLMKRKGAQPGLATYGCNDFDHDD